jgi:hypothetical protein
MPLKEMKIVNIEINTKNLKNKLNVKKGNKTHVKIGSITVLDFKINLLLNILLLVFIELKFFTYNTFRIERIISIIYISYFIPVFEIFSS